MNVSDSLLIVRLFDLTCTSTTFNNSIPTLLYSVVILVLKVAETTITRTSSPSQTWSWPRTAARIWPNTQAAQPGSSRNPESLTSAQHFPPSPPLEQGCRWLTPAPKQSHPQLPPRSLRRSARPQGRPSSRQSNTSRKIAVPWHLSFWWQ